ncbi:hypothetical protein MWU52_11555 [Jannaschia sp. S6380]|uniref:hypothetical protein n=1 Tax=Jannaschia sp. S6380 TaxID=2926408 RepID=UPI001FF1D528|nr:hypothetical protein [Jannaschia sp. S6380]MCK0168190.1 hypothetical protein [Jannaschia sp. S6380]
MPDRRFDYVAQAQARGHPAPDAETMQGLLDIVDEGTLGASNHVALALPLVARLAAMERATARDEALSLARFIAETRGQGAPIVANALSWQIAGADGMNPSAAANLLRTRAAEWDVAAATRRRDLIAAGARALSGMRAPLIFDYSSTVADLVRASAARLDRIVIPESRAIDGGRRYMTALADLDVPILFLPDAAIDHAMARSDAVLLGAESVSRDGGIVNTIGSIMTARTARAHGVAVHGAADLFKVGDRDATDLPSPAARRYDGLLRAGEVASTEAPELEVVPPALITSILTERGPVAPDGLAALCPDA